MPHPRLRLTLQSPVRAAPTKPTRKLIAMPGSLPDLLFAATTAFGRSIMWASLGGAVLDDADMLLLRDDDGVTCGGLGTEASDEDDGAPGNERVAEVFSVSPRPCLPLRGSGWVRLVVGGQLFSTTIDTLTKDPGSMLARMFGVPGDQAPWTSQADATGAFLFDRSPVHFEPVLNFLRHGRVILDAGVNPHGVLEEARFFNVDSMLGALQCLVAEYDRRQDPHGALKRHDVVAHLLDAGSSVSLRFQGVNLEGCDLSNLDLRHINFKLANLRGCNLTACNLQFCNFDRANLAGATLDRADLMGCVLARANFEGCSLRDCNFNDPSQCTTTSLEGANLRSAVLDDSNLSCVNLRVACLKNASLVNCVLRCANLAGTDLANCDLTGCNLQGANLRGANTLGAQFHDLTEAVHMSQSVFSFTASSATSGSHNVPVAFVDPQAPVAQ